MPFNNPIDYIRSHDMVQKKKEADEVTQLLEEELLRKFRQPLDNSVTSISTPKVNTSSSNTVASTLGSIKQRLMETN